MSARGVSDLERGVHRAPYRDTLVQLMDALALDDQQRQRLIAAATRTPARSAAAATPVVPHNIVEEPTSFVGRVEELGQLRKMLRRSEVRMVTLTGPGGSGKTRLVLHAALGLLDSFPQGVFLVSLANLGDPRMVPGAIAAVLGIAEREDVDALTTVKAHLRDRKVLLLLDNFEHLLDASDILPELLEDCPDLSLLVTSRTVLRLSWERVFPVLPLPVPDLSALTDVGVLADYDGAALFVERAHAANSSFALTAENAMSVAEICHRLDGLPLAIELAAARIRLFSPQALLSRLDNRLAVLVGGARDRPARQLTIRATIAWSYSLMDGAEQRLFRRLAVFAGGCTLDTVEAISAEDGDAEPDVLDTIGSLVDKSLLAHSDPNTDAEPRFRMLETIREFAMEQLVACGDADLMRRRHARHFLHVAEQAVAGPGRGARGARGESLDRLQDEYDNLRAALAWCCEHPDVEVGLRLAIALSQFWELRGHLTEGRHWLTRLLALAEGAPTAPHAGALLIAGRRAFTPDLADAARLTGRALALYRGTTDRHGLAECLYQSGTLALGQADYSAAVRFFDECRALATELGDADLVGRALSSLVPQGSPTDPDSARRAMGDTAAVHQRSADANQAGAALETLLYVARIEGDLNRMLVLFEDTESLLRRPNVRPDTLLRERLQRIAFEMTTLGEYQRAIRLLTDAVDINLRVGARRDAAHLWTSLAQFCRELGDYPRAITLLDDALAVFRELDDVSGLVTSLIGRSDVARDQADTERSAELAAAALTMARQLGDVATVGYAQHNLALAAWRSGDHARADVLFTAALDGLAHIVEGTAEVLTSKGMAALDRGDAALAVTCFVDSLKLIPPGDLAWLVATNLEGLAGVAADAGEWCDGARLLGAAHAVRRDSGTPVQAILRPLLDRWTTAIREALGQSAFDADYLDGGCRTVTEVVGSVLNGPGGLVDVPTDTVWWRGFRA